jgi:hypothetical protein
MFITFAVSNKRGLLIMVNEEQELKAHIEEEEELLRFFAVFEEEFKDFESKAEWEIAVDECLDNLIPLYRRLKE